MTKTPAHIIIIVVVGGTFEEVIADHFLAASHVAAVLDASSICQRQLAGIIMTITNLGPKAKIKARGGNCRSSSIIARA
ncbi:hypothetical protein A0H81_08604 [Grifola frondosa]|uniref:Uncharacterized protein n=1 Tax=Grifola frondosa TaxID=5627 RepID=A0A1C7M5D4_GRIFR|nr:hypothetical protein A0H81_08604 [Grifola frondosa]